MSSWRSGGIYAELHRKQLLEEEIGTPVGMDRPGRRSPRQSVRRRADAAAAARTSGRTGGTSALGIVLSIVVSAMEAVRPYFIKVAVDENIAQRRRAGPAPDHRCSSSGHPDCARRSCSTSTPISRSGSASARSSTCGCRCSSTCSGSASQFFDRNPIGRLITRVTNDVEVLNEMFSSGIVMVFSDVFTIIGILWFMFSMNWKLALVSLSVLPLLFYGTFLFRKKAREAYREVRLQIARINTFMQEHITGMMVDQMFNREQKAYRAVHAGSTRAHRDANIRSIFYYALFYPGVELIGAIAVGLIIWYAGVEALDGTVTIGTVMAFLQFNEMFWRPIRDLSEKYNIMQTAMASSERVFKLLDDTTLVPDPEHPVPLRAIRGDIEFRNVWFAYNTTATARNRSGC